MLRSVLLKALFDQRRTLLAWAVSFAALEAMYMSFWPSIRDLPTFSDYLDQMPEVLRNLFAMSGADMSTPVGYVQIELFAFMGPILVLLYTIGAGANAIAGEEDSRTLDLLLAQPVSRTRIVLEKLGAMVIGAAVLGAVAALTFLVLGPAFELHVDGDKIAAALTHLVLLGLVFGALALAVGSATGRPGLAKAVAGVAAVAAYVVNGLAPLVDWLEPVQRVSPFYQYGAHDPLRNGISAGGAAVAIGTVVVLAAIAVLTFRRRDVAG
ncbi:ABC transporter permease subunit [Cumulibacter manganitolerans]|uniref:ABC transporter permease subunit n=1 Tax=Cumulibacter manganitolerans TaxID=1884992 RepID=UPI001296B512|nr:ABC transporter permease subunit [Cumulibacter manganitolerans]